VRTTVTLDDDVAAKLKRLARERDVSFKEVLNSSVRRGIEQGEPRSRPYRVRTRDLGMRPGVNLDKALQLAGEMEDAEIVRKTRLGK
jgi:hypothetical protein